MNGAYLDHAPVTSGRARTLSALAVYLVTDTTMAAAGRGVLSVVDEAVSGGVTAVQLRDHGASARELLDLAVRMAAVIDGRTAFLVDDRVDIVLAARREGAHIDGVHLGQDDLPVGAARALLGADAIIGLTANTPEHLEQAHALPPGTVDYLGVGVIRPTATKPDHPAPLGIDGFAEIARRTPLPCVAIGGVGIGDVEALRAAGAAGTAVVSAICAAEDPRAIAAELSARWRR